LLWKLILLEKYEYEITHLIFSLLPLLIIIMIVIIINGEIPSIKTSSSIRWKLSFSRLTKLQKFFQSCLYRNIKGHYVPGLLSGKRHLIIKLTIVEECKGERERETDRQTDRTFTQLHCVDVTLLHIHYRGFKYVG